MRVEIIQAFDGYDTGWKVHHPAGEKLTVARHLGDLWIGKGLAVEVGRKGAAADVPPAPEVDEVPPFEVDTGGAEEEGI
ncbi:hypothetical protein [Rhodobium gokarnense]|uniref:Uncharacterized protein n=1 Tax=Rhodobium gokarnense TaxID=364296 RepID=A0ABT3HHK6_9HYPH|nr:hypothetical protein [Rhodobium gokarnense]MCW2309736.1 hypothetical protein [Rhodobium gokarnense]